MQYHHKQPDETVNVTTRNPIKEFAQYLAVIVLFIGGIYYFSAYTVELIVPHVSQHTEQWMWDHLLKTHYVIKDNKRDKKLIATEAYLQHLLDRIPKKNVPDFDYRIILVDAKDINAMALPAGKIIVYRGLLDMVSSENALVFVLGHELGHFAHRDHLRGMGRGVITSVILAPIAASAGDMSKLFGMLNVGFDTHFSREQESAADEFGLQRLVDVYGHAGGATEFFNTMAKQEQMAMFKKYMASHPISKDRTRYLERVIKDKNIPTRAVVVKKI